MNDGALSWEHLRIILPLFGAAVGWYVSSRLAASAIASNPAAALRRAAAQAMPVLFVALAAIERHEPQIAIGVIFGSCVATLSLVLGVVTLTAPPDVITIDARRKWGFVLPVAMLTFLAGYQSQLTLLHALVFAVQGIVVLVAWVGGAKAGESSAGLYDFIEFQGLICRGARLRGVMIVVITLIVAVLAALLAGWGAVSGATGLLERSDLPSISIIAALLLGPALVIPMIGTDNALAARRHYTDVVSSQVGFVLLNLCVVLPLVIVAQHARSMGQADDPPLAFPLIVWRVDCVMLMVLGVALLPMSFGRWVPGRIEGVLLILLYGAYMLLWRWGSSMG